MTFMFDKAIVWSLGTVIALISIDTLMGFMVISGRFGLVIRALTMSTEATSFAIIYRVYVSYH